MHQTRKVEWKAPQHIINRGVMLQSAIVSFMLLIGLSGFHPTNASVDMELECMSNAIYHEARGESYEGQLAVANVIVNRVRSEKYSYTICEVVGQKHKETCQFSYFCSEQQDINEPMAYIQSLEVAAAVMKSLSDGTSISDLSSKRTECLGDETMWYHTKYVKPRWSRKLKKTCVIDNHIFYETN